MQTSVNDQEAKHSMGPPAGIESTLTGTWWQIQKDGK